MEKRRPQRPKRPFARVTERGRHGERILWSSHGHRDYFAMSEKCPLTGKRRYADSELAKDALASTIYVRRKNSELDSKRREARIYMCRACWGWHLTSQPE